MYSASHTEGKAKEKDFSSHVSTEHTLRMIVQGEKYLQGPQKKHKILEWDIACQFAKNKFT